MAGVASLGLCVPRADCRTGVQPFHTAQASDHAARVTPLHPPLRHVPKALRLREQCAGGRAAGFPGIEGKLSSLHGEHAVWNISTEY